jgi:hypothetical protein
MMLRAEDRKDQAVAVLLIVLGALFRLAPHPDNFTPTLAIALFAGTVLPTRLAFTVPLLLMMVSDLFLGFHGLMPLIWACTIGLVALGAWIRGRDARLAPAMGASLAGSVAFFLLSNLGVFLFEGMYPMSWAGLAECFTMALPFFRNSLAGDLFYSAAIFGLFLAAQWTRQPKKAS